MCGKQSREQKGNDVPVIKLQKNPDIAATIGAKKEKGQILVGFALETDNELSNAKAKILKKNLDFIVLNSLRDKDAGFGTDTNKITIIDSAGAEKVYGLKSKAEVAKDIIDEIAERIAK